MSLNKTVRDLEKDKFGLNDDGEVIVRTSAEGEFTFSGLKTGGKITEVTLNDSSWISLPVTALSGRNAIAIQNYSPSDIKLNYDNGEAGYIGVTVPAGGERQYDITDGIVIYGKSESGTTPTVTIEELA